MIKKIVVLLTLVATSIFGAYEDYTLFSKGKTLYEQGLYNDAKTIFDTLSKEYENSPLFTSEYAQHYIGLNYYFLEDYEMAVKYLKEAKYKPLELSEGAYFRSKKTDYFQYENEFYLAMAYEKLGMEEDSIYYLKLLQKNYFDLELDPYRQKALMKLKEKDSYYEYIYEIIYKEDFSNLSNLTDEDLLLVANYFFSKGKLTYSQDIYKVSLTRNKDIKVEEKLLETLFRQKKHEDVITLASELLKEKEENLYLFYLGNSNRRLGNYQIAIDYLLRVEEDSKYYSEANYILGRLYLVYKNNNEALKHLHISTLWTSKELEAETYYKHGKENDYKGLIQFIEEHKWWDISGKYRYKLYKYFDDEKYLEDILVYNVNTYYYELALSILEKGEIEEFFPIDEYNKKYSDLVETLDVLNEFEDKELAKIAISEYNFDKSDSLYRVYLRILNYEEGEDYYNALNLAIRNQSNFYKYTNLRTHLYPKHYKEYVDTYTREYGVEDSLVYSIIRQESHFNKNVISTASAYGLMQMIIPTARRFDVNVKPIELLSPENSIKYGTHYLSLLLSDYNGSIPTTAASYNGGPGNVKKWSLDENGDIIIDSITFTETQKYVEKVMNNYLKYKRIYDIK